MYKKTYTYELPAAKVIVWLQQITSTLWLQLLATNFAARLYRDRQRGTKVKPLISLPRLIDSKHSWQNHYIIPDQICNPPMVVLITSVKLTYGSYQHTVQYKAGNNLLTFLLIPWCSNFKAFSALLVGDVSLSPGHSNYSSMTTPEMTLLSWKYWLQESSTIFLSWSHSPGIMCSLPRQNSHLSCLPIREIETFLSAIWVWVSCNLFGLFATRRQPLSWHDPITFWWFDSTKSFDSLYGTISLCLCFFVIM